MSDLQRFVNFCRNIQPQSQEDIRHFFEGVIYFPYDNELLLQSFLHLNVTDYFPFCKDLLLFEKSPNGSNTDKGKCDFVYLTRDEKIALIETKFIDTEKTGTTNRTKRNHHRNKVFEQAITLKQKFSDQWNISTDLIKCCVFTTEDLAYRNESTDVDSKHILIKQLRQWQQEAKIALSGQGHGLG